MQNGKSAFTDANGRPLIAGNVAFYSVGTNTPKDTWRDPAQTVLNTNPVMLDARGEASIYGSGPYRQVLRDFAGNLIWDQIIPDMYAPINEAINTFALSAITQIENVAALRQLSKLFYRNAQTRGYYSVGDNGSGRYYLDTTDVTTADNGGTVIVASDGGRWKLIHDGSTTFRQWGCKGDGITADTVAFQSAVTNGTLAGIKLELPSGNYLLTGVIKLPTSNVCITGGGNKSQISWAHTGHLFDSLATGTNTARYHSFDRFKIMSTIVRSSDEDDAAYAFNFGSGVVRSNWEDIELITDGVASHGPYGFFSSDMNSTQDTLNFNNIEINGFIGIGYNFSKGSSVWVRGGRVIGTSQAEEDSVGMLFNGGMGGVWIWGTDLIFCGTALWTTKNNGSSNREIFLTHGCADSCGAFGYRLDDSCYFSATGIWAASCNIANFLLQGTFDGILNISGGSIFNGGAYGLGGPGDGLVINAASRVSLDGVAFRSNLGFGLRHPVGNQPLLMTIGDCTFSNNGANSIGGIRTRVDGCTFAENTTPLNITSPTAGCKITNTSGVNDTINIVTPSMPTSGFDLVVGTYSPVIAYLQGGSVSAVSINGVVVINTSNISIPLSPGDVVRLTFTSAPNWTWVRADL